MFDVKPLLLTHVKREGGSCSVPIPGSDCDTDIGLTSSGTLHLPQLVKMADKMATGWIPAFQIVHFTEVPARKETDNHQPKGGLNVCSQAVLCYVY